MREFGLTGGIGSGKSTVSTMLTALGAEVIDADAIVRELQAPDERVFDMMVDRWGQKIVTAEGLLDRGAVAEIVFGDSSELDALNAIVHPAVAEVTEQRLAALSDTDVVVVHDIPLLVLPGGEVLSSRDVAEWSGIVVVDVDLETARSRVVESRGMSDDEVAARQRQQATREERVAAADFVIDNNGDLDALSREVDRCWEWMLAGGAPVGDFSEGEGSHEFG